MTRARRPASTAQGTPVYCAFDKLAELETITPNPRNPNKHPEQQLDLLSKIIKAQGWRAPITVSNRSGFIVRGHARLEAARINGETDAPVDFQDYETEAAEHADLVADNRIAELAEVDVPGLAGMLSDVELAGFDIALTGFDPKTFKDLKTAAIEDGSRVIHGDDDEPPVPVEPVTKPGDLYRLGRHVLYCGNSTETVDLERVLAGAVPALVYADPPYGVNIIGSGWAKRPNVPPTAAEDPRLGSGGARRGKVGNDSPLGSKRKGRVGGGGQPNFGLKKSNRAAARTYKAQRYLPITGDDTTDTALKSYAACLAVAPEAVLIFWGGQFYADALPASACWIVWDKQNTGNFADVEMAWTNQQTAARLFRHRWNGMLRASEKDAARVHPTQKPIALAAWTFEQFTAVGSVVLDPFCGSGSGLLAAEQTGRTCYALEIEPGYCDVIKARWEKLTGLTAEGPFNEDG